MDKQREEGYQGLSKEVEVVLREMGVTKGEYAVIGYYLLKNNLEHLSKEIQLDSNVARLLEEAEKLLKEY